jgi:hypothetical protein
MDDSWEHHDSCSLLFLKATASMDELQFHSTDDTTKSPDSFSLMLLLL